MFAGTLKAHRSWVGSIPIPNVTLALYKINLKMAGGKRLVKDKTLGVKPSSLDKSASH